MKPTDGASLLPLSCRPHPLLQSLETVQPLLEVLELLWLQTGHTPQGHTPQGKEVLFRQREVDLVLGTPLAGQPQFLLQLMQTVLNIT